jgi:hypothetical protein
MSEIVTTVCVAYDNEITPIACRYRQTDHKSISISAPGRNHHNCSFCQCRIAGAVGAVIVSNNHVPFNPVLGKNLLG